MVSSTPHVKLTRIPNIVNKPWYKRLFCKHDYWKMNWEECMDYRRQERYTLRYYTCLKCGKKIIVDGRYDPYAR